jgi:hypothetical protein
MVVKLIAVLANLVYRHCSRGEGLIMLNTSSARCSEMQRSTGKHPGNRSEQIRTQLVQLQG